MASQKYNDHIDPTASLKPDVDLEFRTQNSEFRVLHLYHDLMNLYGDWANTSILALELRARGCKAIVDRKSVGDDIDFNDYDFVHIGSGTERSLRACMRDLCRYKQSFFESIDHGLHVLATGNSHELFGKTVTEADGEKYDALGLLDFETLHEDTRVTGDSICMAPFLHDKLIGFVNRAGGGQVGDIDRPFTVEMGPGSNDLIKSEGIRYKNMLGTYLTGPVLVRNPPLLRFFADLLTGGVPRPHIAAGNGMLLFKHQEAAYSMALRELEERLGLQARMLIRAKGMQL